MCGIVGFTKLGLDNFSICSSMLDELYNRGPDDSGVWYDESSYIVLGHRRLSIQDLSSAGHQPMQSSCGRYVIVFNGEIYNHIELRKLLNSEGLSIEWRGHSDTETILESISIWGVENTLSKLIGMFAFALYDRVTHKLTLSRDRMGEKPLYWGWCDDLFVFASELKAIKAHPNFRPLINRDSLTLLLRHGYIPAPHSIYQGINKLLPGHLVEIPFVVDLQTSRSVQSSAYWSVKDVVEKGISNPFSGSLDEAVNVLEASLKESVSSQLISDVPIGAFLSGGVDSSTIVALMQEISPKPIKTFSIGFEDANYNEAQHAKAVAQHLGTDHHELYVTEDQAQSVIPKLQDIYCEPFADSSQLPTYLVSQLAKSKVTVSLSGDGGDELFGGYNRYLAAGKIWGTIERLPYPVRLLLSKWLKSPSPKSWDSFFRYANYLLPKKLVFSSPGDKVSKIADVLPLNSPESYYRQLTSFWNDPAALVIGGSEPETIFTDKQCWPQTDSFEQFMMFMDAMVYMPDDILTKVDRAAMANSLETRIPMLDHRIIELASCMPLEYKIREGQGKWILRQVLYRYVPKDLIERPKMGFAVPLDSWLRGPLREWAEALLSEDRLNRDGYFRVEPIRRLWIEHLSGRVNRAHILWSVLMFQSWLDGS